MVILSSFKASFWIAFLAATTLIFGAAYTLWLVKRVIFGAVGNHHVAELEDVGSREIIMLSLLAAAVLLLGLWPDPLTATMHATVDNLLQHITVTKL
jgi:NADH-quinone oxidoreductase subunit M